MNSVLIDSQVLIWWLSRPDKLEEDHKKIIEDTACTVYISIGSLWEIHIKAGLNKLTLPDELEQELTDQLIQILPIEFRHLSTLMQLPDHHKDPFDRIIIAQAKADNIPVISYDRRFESYPVTLV